MPSNLTTPADLATLAATARSLKTGMEQARARYYQQGGSYDDMAQAAQRYCEAIYRWQLARFGKGKRPCYRAMLR